LAVEGGVAGGVREDFDLHGKGMLPPSFAHAGDGLLLPRTNNQGRAALIGHLAERTPIDAGIEDLTVEQLEKIRGRSAEAPGKISPERDGR
jgi:hypothetical protein